MGNNGKSDEEKLREEVEDAVLDDNIDWDEDDEVEDGA